METIAAETQIMTALQTKRSQYIKYLTHHWDKVRVYRENRKKYNRLYEVTQVSNKMRFMTDEIKVKQYKITSILPIPPKPNDLYLKHGMKNIEKTWNVLLTKITIPFWNRTKLWSNIQF